MKCEVCKNRIINKPTFHNLFSREVNHICENCFKLSRIEFQVETIPLDNGYVLIHFFILNEKPKKYTAYMSFLAPIYQTLITGKCRATILYFDEFNDKIYTQVNKLNDNVCLISII